MSQQRILLLTPHGVREAEERARKNPEDLYALLRSRAVKHGLLYRVENKERKFGAAREYLVTWVEDADGSNERAIAFTKTEVREASKRADSNPEDVEAFRIQKSARQGRLYELDNQDRRFGSADRYIVLWVEEAGRRRRDVPTPEVPETEGPPASGPGAPPPAESGPSLRWRPRVYAARFAAGVVLVGVGVMLGRSCVPATGSPGPLAVSVRRSGDQQDLSLQFTVKNEGPGPMRLVTDEILEPGEECGESLARGERCSFSELVGIPPIVRDPEPSLSIHLGPSTPPPAADYTLEVTNEGRRAVKLIPAEFPGLDLRSCDPPILGWLNAGETKTCKLPGTRFANEAGVEFELTREGEREREGEDAVWTLEVHNPDETRPARLDSLSELRLSLGTRLDASFDRGCFSPWWDVAPLARERCTVSDRPPPQTLRVKMSEQRTDPEVTTVTFTLGNETTAPVLLAEDEALTPADECGERLEQGERCTLSREVQREVALPARLSFAASTEPAEEQFTVRCTLTNSGRTPVAMTGSACDSEVLGPDQTCSWSERLSLPACRWEAWRAHNLAAYAVAQQSWDRAAPAACEAFGTHMRCGGDPDHPEIYAGLLRANLLEPPARPDVRRQSLRFVDVPDCLDPGAVDSKAAVRALALNPAGDKLAVGSEDGRVHVFDRSSGRLLRELSGLGSAVRSLAWSPQGWLAAGREDGTIHAWMPRQKATESAPETVELFDQGEGAVHALAFNHDGSLLASGGSDGTVRIWADPEPRAGQEPCRSIVEGRIDVWDVAFGPDGRRLASSSSDGVAIREVDANCGLERLEARTTTSGAACRALAFGGDEGMLACGTTEGTILLWDRSAERPVRLDGHASGVTALSFHQDRPSGALRLASAGLDGTVRLWKRSTSRQDQLEPEPPAADWWNPVPIVLRGHDSWVWALAFGVDGEELYSGSQDRTVRRWKTRSEQLARELAAAGTGSCGPVSVPGFGRSQPDAGP